MMNLYTKLSSPLDLLRSLYLIMGLLWLTMDSFTSISQESSILFAFVPVLIYSNPEIQKDQIYSENKGKSGIYR
jgi:hypothetical protein